MIVFAIAITFVIGMGDVEMFMGMGAFRVSCIVVSSTLSYAHPAMKLQMEPRVTTSLNTTKNKTDKTS